MKDSIRRKLEKLDERFEEVGRLLSEPEVIARQNQFRDLSMEYARLGPLVDRYRGFIALEDDAETARELAMEEELRDIGPRLEAEELELQRLLVPKDPLDDSNIFLEVRAGTGGDEAALFAGDLFRMYARFAESRRWEVEILSESPGEQWRLQGDHQPRHRQGCVLAAQVRVGHASGAAGARDRSAGPDPHLGRHRRHSSGARGGSLHRVEPGGFAHRHIPLLRSRRAARQQDRLRDPRDASPHRHRGRVPGTSVRSTRTARAPCRC